MRPARSIVGLAVLISSLGLGLSACKEDDLWNSTVRNDQRSEFQQVRPASRTYSDNERRRSRRDRTGRRLGRDSAVLLPHFGDYAVHEAGFSTTRFKNAHGTFTIELIDDCNDWTLQEKWDLKLNDQAGKPEPSNLLYRGSEVKSAGKFVFAYSRNHLGELTDYIGDVIDVGGDFMARFQTPRISERLLSPDVVFPITHLHQILSEARRGRTGFEATVFDGANAITYRAVTSIGRPLRSDDTNPRVVAARTELDRKNSDRLPDGRQWPIRIDYFPLGDNYAPPVFSREILLHENGIILSFHFDYVDIRLEARLKTLDIREPKACPQ